MAFKKKNKDEEIDEQRPPENPGGGVTTVVEVRDEDEHGAMRAASIATNPPANVPAPDRQNVRLGDQLLANNLITEAQLQKALEMQRDSGGLLGEVLVSTGALTEQALAHALANFFGFDVANLRRDNVDPAMLNFLPESVAREFVAFPVRMEDDSLFVAVAEPSEDLRNALAKASGKPVQITRRTPQRSCVGPSTATIGHWDQWRNSFRCLNQSKDRARRVLTAPNLRSLRTMHRSFKSSIVF